MAVLTDVKPQLVSCLKELHLPTFRQAYESVAKQAQQETLSYESYLLELATRECQERRHKRIDRLLHVSRLPLEKNLQTFDLKRLPRKVQQQVRVLLEGSFVDRRENVLAFGKPGLGKTHLLCAITQELVRKGRRALYSPCSLLVQELLLAKRELKLHRLLKRLAAYDILLLDKCGATNNVEPLARNAELVIP